jgi:hypothetical protein
MKLHGIHECHYACKDINQTICAYQKEEQMNEQMGGMNFSSVCNRDMYNCQNPAHSEFFYSQKKSFIRFQKISLSLQALTFIQKDHVPVKKRIENAKSFSFIRQ